MHRSVSEAGETQVRRLRSEVHSRTSTVGMGVEQSPEKEAYKHLWLNSDEKANICWVSNNVSHGAMSMEGLVAAIQQGSYSRCVPGIRIQEARPTHVLYVHPVSVFILKSPLCPLKPPYSRISQHSQKQISNLLGLHPTVQ